MGIVTARRRARSARRRPRPPRPVAASRVTAESLLLVLARALSTRSEETAGVAAIVEAIATAYAADAPLARALREEPAPKGDDKAARLALAWAREQVRLAVVERLQHARAARRLRPDGDIETLAWLCVAAGEALAHEPPEVAPDRLNALTTFLTGGERVLE